MHATGEPLPASGGRSFLRAWATVVVLAVGLVTLTTVTTQTQAHAGPAVVLVGSRVVTGLGLASLTGEVLSRGTGDLVQRPRSQPQVINGTVIESTTARKGGRLGRMIQLASTLGNIAQIGMPWKLKEGQSPTYADTPASTAGTSAGTLYFPTGRAKPAVSYSVAQRWNATNSRSELQITYTLIAQEPIGNASVFAGAYLANGSLSGGTIFHFAPVGAVFTTAWMDQSLYAYGHGLGAYDGSSYENNDQVVPTPTPMTGPESPSVPAEVTTTTESTCSDGSSTSSTMTWRGSDAVMPDIVIPPCPEGTRRVKVEQESTTTDGRTVDSPLGIWTEAPVPAGYPDCATTGCLLQLWVVSPVAGTAPQLCNDTSTCDRWVDRTSTSPAVKTLTITNPDGTTGTEVARAYPDGRWMECRYGSYLVTTSECEVIPTEVLEDPTGEDSNCELSDFSLNPVSWVVVPLRCLFIPRDSAVQAAASSIGTAWDGTAPAVVSGEVGKVFAPVVALQDDEGQSCEGPEFAFPALAGVTEPFSIHPLSTCNELTQYLLGIYMPLATAFVYLGGFFAGTRILLKTINVDSPVADA